MFKDCETKRFSSTDSLTNLNRDLNDEDIEYHERESTRYKTITKDKTSMN